MIVFIVNPISGMKRARRVWPILERHLQQKNVLFQRYFTERPGHAVELARRAAREQVETIVAVGGDGTVHEVVNGLYGMDTRLGYIPMGSGNDFARAQSIPWDPVEALERILDGRTAQVDTADFYGTEECQGTVVSTAGIGFDGSVTRWVNQFPIKKYLGKWSYVVGVFRVLWQFQPTEVTLYLDGKEHQFNKAWLVAVANIAFYGGGMKICPSASNDDGLLDICVVDGISKGMLFLRMFPRVFFGTHIGHPAVHTFQARQVRIESRRELDIQIDGESKGKTPIEFAIHPSSLRIG
ncbi:lipid kinase, YegS/Rv2252/BmrU family [Marininema mesophilum]|uniref:Lipid kinase, YegS/Rv2252/BmrU family n=1 Tax=Marininema mesophilum TaxID=1048340 RepID=A0A1H3AG63_9BACL|nr:diacylglycerol kinase family protein [Marininema mesophilum]SDX28308.1 lipid kinase, YegS/Rv2252/BmrU family [Marininema mesophilum]